MSSFTKTSSTTNISSEEDAEQLRRGPWTPEEDSLLMHHISCHGEGHWNSLAKRAGLRRTGKSCRLRWLNYLKPDVKRGNLTPGEQYLILELHSKLGNRWSKIAQHLPGRTDNEIKNYWRTRVQKQARLLKVDANSGAFRDVVRCFWMPRLLQKMESEHPAHVQATDRTSTEQIVARQGHASLSEAVECLEQQNSESEKCASSCVSSSESMNNNNPSHISEFAKYQTSPFGIVGDNEFAKDCYYVDDNNIINNSSSCYDMGTINLASTSAVGDGGCHMAENDWVNDGFADGIWSIWGSCYGNQGASIEEDVMLFSSQFHH